MFNRDSEFVLLFVSRRF